MIIIIMHDIVIIIYVFMLIVAAAEDLLGWHFPIQYDMTAVSPIATETKPCWLIHQEFATYYSTAWRVPLAISYKLTKSNVVSSNYKDLHVYHTVGLSLYNHLLLRRKQRRNQETTAFVVMYAWMQTLSLHSVVISLRGQGVTWHHQVYLPVHAEAHHLPLCIV